MFSSAVGAGFARPNAYGCAMLSGRQTLPLREMLTKDVEHSLILLNPLLPSFCLQQQDLFSPSCPDSIYDTLL
jgi:hypothetical protein